MLRVLLVTGLGPSFKNHDYLANSLFDRNSAEHLRVGYYGGFDIDQLCFDLRGRTYPLLRPRRGAIPHLTTFTLESILHGIDGVEYDVLRTERIWIGEHIQLNKDYQWLLVSTSFVWDQATLGHLLDRLKDLCPGARIILGGQYSNLKYRAIMEQRLDVMAIVRGDGESAIPLLLAALAKGSDLAQVPNLVYRDGTSVHTAPYTMIDLDAHPSPQLSGQFPVIPYESMRGCPYSCKFCSFPAASPVWRYKSAVKIRDDWNHYSEKNGARFIKAMDSTFTVPYSRLSDLIRLLPSVKIAWEAYSRANSIKNEALLEGLAEAHCRFLSIGFESMSPRTLEYMNKKVTVSENLHAFRLLSRGPIEYRCSFMAGYPGETPEDYKLTHEFLAGEYSGHFMLSVFSLSDEQMPVWEDAERFKIRIHDPNNPDYSWEHSGMDVDTARSLNHNTLDEVRRSNDGAVLMLWQADYQHWLMPHLPHATNLKIEKLVERIAMLPRDCPDPYLGREKMNEYLTTLAEDFGVYAGEPARFFREPLLEN
jgi:anaerobic magnesium-protoporphyrin IX monomethyl ester cyclase